MDPSCRIRKYLFFNIFIRKFYILYIIFILYVIYNGVKMNKKIICLIIVAMFLLTGLSISVSARNLGTICSLGDTIYVDDDGGADYINISDAVEAAENGDTIFVYNGVYYENELIIEKSITLEGENKDNTILIGNGDKPILYLRKSGISVTKFKFKGFENKEAIRFGINALVSSSYENIELSDLIFEKLNIESYSVLDNVHIHNCNFIDVKVQAIVTFYFSSNLKIESNTFLRCGAKLGDGWYRCAIYFDKVENLIFSNNKLLNCASGIDVRIQGTSKINNNDIDASIHGVNIYNKNGELNIFNNVIKSEEFGAITVSNSNNVNVYGNSLKNANSGIYIQSCNQMNVNNNEFFNNNNGVDIWHSESITVKNNIITDNNNGIHIYNSYENKIQENNISSNSYGIICNYNSESNLIINNNFLQNDVSATDKGIDNSWDDGSQGNYWSDYDGRDINQDGIGDKPYEIFGGNSKDNYPWMKPDGESKSKQVTFLESFIERIMNFVYKFKEFFNADTGI